MPRNMARAVRLIRRWEETTAPEKRYADLAIRFRLADGDDAGQLTHCYGGTWDRDRSPWVGYKSTWNRDSHLWECDAGITAPEPVVSPVSVQALPLATDLWTRTVFAVGGRRSGKSYGAAQKCSVLVLRFPGLKGMVLSPTYRQARNVFDAIYRIVPRAWLLAGHRGFVWSNEHKSLRFVNGSEIVFRSADNPEGCRSDGVAWLLADEWQDIGEEAYSNAHLSLSEGGDDYLITITATIKPELRERYDKLKELEQNSVGLAKVLRMRSRGNPFIGHSMFDEAAQFLDEARVQQELEAKWPELVGRIYYPFSKDVHVHNFPLPGRKDETAAILGARFGAPFYGDGSADWFISVDPPGHAAIWKLYGDGSMHLVHEVLVGADGIGGDIRTLAERCSAICRTGVVVQDPHDRKWDKDIRKYFKYHGFRMVSLRRLPPEYRITAMRAQLERDRFYVSPNCVHSIEVLEKHQYKADKPGEPCKVTCYQRAHHRESKRIQYVHLADAMGYGVYKLNPARYDYEKNEKQAA